MKVQFRIEQQGDNRVVTCPAMPGFKYEGSAKHDMLDAYTAFTVRFERNFEQAMYANDGGSTTYVDVNFRIMGD